MRTRNQVRTGRAAVTVAALMTLGACGGTSSAGSAGSGGGADPVKVGVLIPGSISDGGYMQSAHDGVEEVTRDLADKVDVSYVEQVDAAGYEQALIGFARSSALVVSIGGQTDAAVRKVAPMFPEVKFVEVGGPPETLPNLAAYDPRQGEAAYLAGAAAALLSTTKKVGFVAGVEIPPIVSAANNFANGARAALPTVTVLPPQYTGDFDDVSKAKEAVLADVRAGGDVFYQIENLGLQGMAAAAEQTDTKVIGGPLDQPCADDKPFAAHTRSDIGAATRYAVEQILAGTWKAEAVSFGLASEQREATDITLCGADAAVTAKLDAIKAGIDDGSVKIV